MAGKMQTFVMKRIGEVGIMEKPAPTPGPNGAVMEIRHWDRPFSRCYPLLC
jgi:hypothetical protein